MSEIIKLFGKTISLPPNKEDLIVLDGDHLNHAYKVCGRVDEQEDDKKPKTSHEELRDPPTSCDNPTTPSFDEEPISPKVSKNDDQSETSISQDQTPKKPDKVIPCPRCSSMETKFCYFNNYNVNQPRHFCKNCQRYWTAGGSMRSVPVGSGRRKNKSSSASHYHHIIVPENANATVLTFGTDYNSSMSDITVSDSTDKGGNSGSQESVMKNFPTLAPRVPCIGGPPWSYRPGFNPSGFPITFYPAPAYWGCTLPGPYWGCTLPEPAMNSSPNSPTLGKHSRDGEDSERHVWIPKTLRIADPSEAAKSSIWSTLGIKKEKMDGGSLFKAFRSKCDEENHRSNMSLALQANPAALARSANFHEQV